MTATLERQGSAAVNGAYAIARADHQPFAALLPHGPVVGDPGDGIILLQERGNPRDAGIGCMWKVEPRNVGAIADAAVEQMAAGLQNLFRSLAPGAVIQVIMHTAPTDRVDRWSRYRAGRDRRLLAQRVPGSGPEGGPGARRRRQALAPARDRHPGDGQAVGAGSRPAAPDPPGLPVPAREKAPARAEPGDRDGPGAGPGRTVGAAGVVRDRLRAGRRRLRAPGLHRPCTARFLASCNRGSAGRAATTPTCRCANSSSASPPARRSRRPGNSDRTTPIRTATTPGRRRSCPCSRPRNAPFPACSPACTRPRTWNPSRPGKPSPTCR